MRLTTPPPPALEDRNRLVTEHVGLVQAVAVRLAQRLPPQVDLADLVSVGVLGLIDAASRYNPASGVPFDAFARRRLHGAMLDALRDLDWAPRSLRKLRRQLDATVARLRHDFGREPAEADVAAAMGLSGKEYERVLDQLRTLEIGTIRQLDGAGPDGAPLLELAIDPEEGPEALLRRSELRAYLAEALRELPERERHVLALYYEEELTLAEVGAVIGVSESRVSQIRTLALSRLRVSLQRILAEAGAPHDAAAGRRMAGAAIARPTASGAAQGPGA